MMKKRAWKLLPLVLMLALLLSGCSAKKAEVDYTSYDNWAYYGIGEDHPADVFLICPTVDMGDLGQFNMALDDADVKEKFIGALNMERGIYEDSLTLYAPYYRQATFPVYLMPEGMAEKYFNLAYEDVRAAFLAYIAQTEPDRPFVLAGFSQGSQMLLRLLKDLFADPAYQNRLIAAYCIGWRITRSDVQESPWLKPATCADDLGSIICFSTEAEGLKESIIVPAGTKTYAINPLNWKTDGTPAAASLNLGACFTDYSGTISRELPALTGAYIEENRGVLVAPDIAPSDYSNSLFPEGVYHLYDYQFFYRNLQENVALRVDTYMNSRK